MKKYIFVIFVILGIVIKTKAQRASPDVIVIPAGLHILFDKPFEMERSRIEDGDKYIFRLNDSPSSLGMIDTIGNIILEPIYEDIYIHSDFVDNVHIYRPFVIVRKDGLEGYFNMDKREFITPIHFKKATSLQEDMAAVSIDGEKWGYIDTTGQMIIEPQWDMVGGFFNGISKVVNDPTGKFKDVTISLMPTPGKSGYIDKKGAYVIPMEYSNINMFVYDSTAAFNRGVYECDYISDPGCQNPYKGYKWGVISNTGKIVIPDDKYDYIHAPFRPFDGRLAAVVELGDKVGVIDYYGNEIVEPTSDREGMIEIGVKYFGRSREDMEEIIDRENNFDGK